MLKENFLKQKLISGETTIGTWIVVPSQTNVEIFSSAGLDFVIIDQEHGPINFETAQAMCSSCELHGTSPLMRIGDINKAFIQNALDIGAHGIQIPNIESKTDANRVIEYSKYPPMGDRGLSPYTRAGNFDAKNAKALTDKANENTLVVFNIEGKGAIENLDEILEVKDFDVIFVGLFDLSKSLGIPGDVNNPLVLNNLQEIINKSKQAKKSVGTIATSHDTVKTFRDMGANYLVYKVDCDVMRDAYHEVVNIIK